MKESCHGIEAGVRYLCYHHKTLPRGSFENPGGGFQMTEKVTPWRSNTSVPVWYRLTLLYRAEEAPVHCLPMKNAMENGTGQMTNLAFLAFLLVSTSILASEKKTIS